MKFAKSFDKALPDVKQDLKSINFRGINGGKAFTKICIIVERPQKTSVITNI